MTPLQDKLKRLDELRRKQTIYKDIFDLYEKVFVERDRIKSNVAVPDNYLDREGASIRIRDGFCLLEKSRFAGDLALLETYFKTLLEMLSVRNPDAALYIRNALGSNDIGVGKIFHDMLSENPEKCLSVFDRERKTFVFLIKETLKPFLEAYCDSLKNLFEPELWTEGVCPVCGSLPFFAELRGEEGMRYLFCPDCGMDWRFERLKCPFCGTDDHKKLEYFFSEKESHYRVILCKACKRYLKTADCREVDGALVPEVDNLATLHLDIIAQNQGFKTEDILVHLLL